MKTFRKQKKTGKNKIRIRKENGDLKHTVNLIDGSTRKRHEFAVRNDKPRAAGRAALTYGINNRLTARTRTGGPPVICAHYSIWTTHCTVTHHIVNSLSRVHCNLFRSGLDDVPTNINWSDTYRLSSLVVIN